MNHWRSQIKLGLKQVLILTDHCTVADIPLQVSLIFIHPCQPLVRVPVKSYTF